MSVPHINLTCNRCDASWSPLQLNKRRVYLDGSVEVPLHSTLGWCEECAALRPVEHFEDAAWTQQEIDAIQAELQSLSDTRVKRFALRLLPGKRATVDWLARQISSLQRRLALIAERRGDEACLVCGSRQLQSFNGDYSLEMDDTFSYVGSKPTGFLHPGCGGEFIATGSDVRFILSRTTYCYDLEGRLIDERR
ncbi:hypothetical protein ACQUQP_09645 [Marinobacterium sp. YM272]|uniref:hypothetical protein n=1 Tax=Marinobacterium sp. YM272 TaxID=3421654 RepID=UPI003D7F92DF